MQLTIEVAIKKRDYVPTQHRLDLQKNSEAAIAHRGSCEIVLFGRKHASQRFNVH